MLKVVFSCGGTGGHINPAISVADYIKNIYPDAEITFIGSDRGMEASLVPKAGYKLEKIAVRGFKRSLSISNADAAIKAVTSVIKAKKILKKIKPDAVVGTGGYASWAAVRAASKLGIPTVIHEQNAYPGVTTRKLSKYADTVCISFEESRKYFAENVRKKIVLTGNPINPSIMAADRALARKKYGLTADDIYILSFGGSLGADKINEYVLEMLRTYISKTNIRYTHAIGKARYKKYEESGMSAEFDSYKNLEILEYIYDMPERMAAADIIICRAGAITIAEAAYLGKALILIPSPNVAEDHQYKNALLLQNGDAAILLKESTLTAAILTDEVKMLAGNRERIKKLSKNIRRFAPQNGTQIIAKTVLEHR